MNGVLLDVCPQCGETNTIACASGCARCMCLACHAARSVEQVGCGPDPELWSCQPCIDKNRREQRRAFERTVQRGIRVPGVVQLVVVRSTFIAISAAAGAEAGGALGAAVGALLASEVMGYAIAAYVRGSL